MLQDPELVPPAGAKWAVMPTSQGKGLCDELREAVVPPSLN